MHTFHKIPESTIIIESFWDNLVHNLFILFQNGLVNVLNNPLSVNFIYMPVLQIEYCIVSGVNNVILQKNIKNICKYVNVHK